MTTPNASGSPVTRPILWQRTGIIAVALVAGFFIIATFFDAEVTRAVAWWPEGEQAFFHWLTEFGEGAVVLVPALVLWLVFLVASWLTRPYWWRWSFRGISALSLFAFGATGLPGLVSAILKRVFGRARPMHLDTDGVFAFTFFQPRAWDYQSFPSGHATTSLAFALAMTLLFGRFGAWLFVPAVLIALSRVVIQMHFLSDVLFGAGLGMVGAWLLALVWRRKGWVFAKGSGWRNRLTPVIARQIRRLVAKARPGSA